MEEIYEESNEIVATFLPMVSEEEEVFNEEESFVEDDGPIFMESTEGGETFSTETFQEEEMIEEESMMTATFQEEEMVERDYWEELGDTLYEYLEDLDLARQTNWREDLPEIAEL